MLFHPINLPYWLFLGVGLLCFALMFFSGEGEGDEDSGWELDADLGGESEGESSALPLQLLGWFGVGKVPLLFLLAMDFTVWGISGWLFNVLLMQITGNLPTHLFGLGGLVFLSSMILSLWLGRSLAHPIGKLFVSFGQDLSSERIIGCVGTVTSKTLPYLVEGRIGQANVFDNQGNLLTISVGLPDWARVVPHHNQPILIIDQSPHAYLAIAKDSSDEDKWLNQSQTSAKIDLLTDTFREENP
jgi:hypothetical protein